MIKRISVGIVTGGIYVLAELTDFIVKKIGKRVRQLVLWEIGCRRESGTAHKITGNFEQLFASI